MWCIVLNFFLVRTSCKHLWHGHQTSLPWIPKWSLQYCPSTCSIHVMHSVDKQLDNTWKWCNHGSVIVKENLISTMCNIPNFSLNSNIFHNFLAWVLIILNHLIYIKNNQDSLLDINDNDSINRPPAAQLQPEHFALLNGQDFLQWKFHILTSLTACSLGLKLISH